MAKSIFEEFRTFDDFKGVSLDKIFEDEDFTKLFS
jgi:hypothetical protein